MNTIYIIRDQSGEIVGTTTDRTKESISVDSAEYKAYLKNTVISATQLWDFIKSERNSLLSQSDWTDLPNSPVKNKEAWLSYRQALRDVPQSFATPEEVVWPNKPE